MGLAREAGGECAERAGGLARAEGVARSQGGGGKGTSEEKTLAKEVESWGDHRGRAGGERLREAKRRG